MDALELAVSLATNGSGVEPGQELLTRDLHHRHQYRRRSCDVIDMVSIYSLQLLEAHTMCWGFAQRRGGVG